MPDTAAVDPRLEVLGALQKDLESCIRKAENNDTAMRASRDTLAAVLKWLEGYKADLHAGLDDGTIPRAAEPYVMACFNDITSHVDKVHSRVADGIRRADVPGYVKGLQKAGQVARHHASTVERRAAAHAARVAREADEDAEWRAGRGAPPAGGQGAPGGDTGAAHGTPQDQPQPADQRQPTDEEGEPPPAAEPDPPASCAHCGDEIAMDTGSANCTPCEAHRGKYGKLPSKRALANRRKADGAD